RSGLRIPRTRGSDSSCQKGFIFKHTVTRQVPDVLIPNRTPHAGNPLITNPQENKTGKVIMAAGPNTHETWETRYCPASRRHGGKGTRAFFNGSDHRIQNPKGYGNPILR